MSIEVVKTFNNFDFSIMKEGNSIWWWGGDVAKVLRYANPDKAIRDHVKDDEKRKVQ